MSYSCRNRDDVHIIQGRPPLQELSNLAGVALKVASDQSGSRGIPSVSIREIWLSQYSWGVNWEGKGADVLPIRVEVLRQSDSRRTDQHE
jgi:hypothetical protein